MVSKHAILAADGSVRNIILIDQEAARTFPIRPGERLYELRSGDERQAEPRGTWIQSGDRVSFTRSTKTPESPRADKLLELEDSARGLFSDRRGARLDRFIVALRDLLE